MAYILHIETSTEICSVALSNDDQLVTEAIGKDENNHAAQLTELITNTLVSAHFSISQLNAVAVSAGPGSYTGLRIGTSTAKGICHALDIPLLAVSTLQSMAEGGRKLYPDMEFICPMIDARRMEIYAAVYDKKGSIILAPAAFDMSRDIFLHPFRGQHILFIGSGVKKCVSLLQGENTVIDEHVFHSAKNMIRLAFKNYRSNDFAVLASFEPDYIKPVYILPGKGSGNR